jgi:endonuclease I
MYSEYNLPIDGKVVALWRELHANYDFYDFEFERNEMIYEKTGKHNYFLDQYD